MILDLFLNFAGRNNCFIFQLQIQDEQLHFFKPPMKIDDFKIKPANVINYLKNKTKQKYQTNTNTRKE